MDSRSALPPIRQLANDLEINPNTVAKAYQILEKRNVIITAGRKGTFVHQNARRNVNLGAEATLRAKVQELILDSTSRGLTLSNLKSIFAAEIKAYSGGTK